MDFKVTYLDAGLTSSYISDGEGSERASVGGPGSNNGSANNGLTNGTVATTAGSGSGSTGNSHRLITTEDRKPF